MRRVVLRLLSIVAGLALAGGPLVPAQPALAASFNPSDYFTYTYTITLSRTYVKYGEVFYASITGTATCIQDAPVQPTEAFVNGRVIAQHVESKARVALNAGYSVSVSSVPSRKGDVFTAVQELPLYFPWDSPIGEYVITGELIEARFKAGLWFDATSSFPETQDMGKAFYRVPEPPPYTPPPAQPPVVPKPPVTGPAPGATNPVPPGTEPVPDPGQLPTSVSPEEPGAGLPAAQPVPQGALNLDGKTDSFGLLNSRLEVSSSDGLCSLAIEPPVGITAGESAPPAWLMVARQPQAPAAAGDSQLIGSGYAVLPGETLFKPGARLTIGYYPAMLPSGMDETRLLMARWDIGDSQWIVLSGCQVDQAANTVSAVIEWADTYAILVPVSPPDFELSGFSIDPPAASPGELVSVQCRVANSGGVTGYYELTLELNGNLHEVRRLMLEGGASRVVSFGVVCDAAGVYNVSLNGQSGTFSISGSQHSYSSVPPAGAAAIDDAGVIYWVQIIYALNLVLLMVILWLSRRWLVRQFAALKNRVSPGK